LEDNKIDEAVSLLRGDLARYKSIDQFPKRLAALACSLINKDIDDWDYVDASNRSLSNRKGIHGVGINDVPWATCKSVNGKLVKHPAYSVWISMFTRSYYAPYQEEKPTYRKCTVSSDWMMFSNFYDWWLEQPDSRGLHFDKDIIYPGNKVYSPKYCMFIAPELNTLLLDCGASRGKYPIGVHYKKPNKKFGAGICKYGKRIHLGYYNTPEEAHKKYLAEKMIHIMQIAYKQAQLIKNGLLRHAEKAMMELYPCSH